MNASTSLFVLALVFSCAAGCTAWGLGVKAGCLATLDDEHRRLYRPTRHAVTTDALKLITLSLASVLCVAIALTLAIGGAS